MVKNATKWQKLAKIKKVQSHLELALDNIREGQETPTEEEKIKIVSMVLDETIKIVTKSAFSYKDVVKLYDSIDYITFEFGLSWSFTYDLLKMIDKVLIIEIFNLENLE